MTFDFITALGLLAGTFTTISFVPQITKLWRTRSTDDISSGMFIIFSLGVALWLIYGWIKGDIAIIVANAITLLFALSILGLKIIYTRQRNR